MINEEKILIKRSLIKNLLIKQKTEKKNQRFMKNNYKDEIIELGFEK